MAWRQWLRCGGVEARRIHDVAFPHAPLEPGRNIRITIDEEVSECCERWRGASMWRSSSVTVATSSPVFPSASSVCTSGPMHPTYCPECGRKL